MPQVKCTSCLLSLCVGEENILLTLAPIWLPHWPAWRWTISRILWGFWDRNCTRKLGSWSSWPVSRVWISRVHYELIEPVLSHKFLACIRSLCFHMHRTVRTGEERPFRKGYNNMQHMIRDSLANFKICLWFSYAKFHIFHILLKISDPTQFYFQRGHFITVLLEVLCPGIWGNILQDGRQWKLWKDDPAICSGRTTNGMTCEIGWSWIEKDKLWLDNLSPHLRQSHALVSWMNFNGNFQLQGRFRQVSLVTIQKSYLPFGQTNKQTAAKKTEKRCLFLNFI